MKIIFLDIDGVLNGHEFDVLSNSSSINRDLMARLNSITDSTGAQVVLSSAWRYMIHGKAMTLKGFQYLLQTHGAHFTLRGFTRKDEDCIYCCKMNDPGVLVCSNCKRESTRGELIRAWMEDNVYYGNYVVIDDLDLGISACGHPFIQTDGKVGIQDEDVKNAIKILSSEG